MEKLLSVLTFLFITWSFGFTVLRLAKTTPEENRFYNFLAQLAVGLATFSFIGVVLNLLGVPLHITVYLTLAAAYPVFLLIRSIVRKEESPLKLPDAKVLRHKSTYYALALLAIMAFTFILFHKGAFVYPYLENDDPWNHAQSATYVARERTYSIDPQVRELNGGYAFYLEPYPPTYGTLMGLMRQTTTSIVWTLKFYNVLLITLGLAFFFLFFRRYLESDAKALFATFVLAVLPSFMSHFIWSQTLAMVIMPVALYAIVRAITDRTWRIPAIIATASMLVTQPVVSFVFGVVVLVLVALVGLHDLAARKGKTLKMRFERTTNAFIVGAGGVALSLVYWGAQLAKWGVEGFVRLRGGEIKFGWGGEYALQRYDWWGQVVHAPLSSRIDQATGFGVMVFLLIVVSMLLLLLLGSRRLQEKAGNQQLRKFVNLGTWIIIGAWALWLIVFLITASIGTASGLIAFSTRPFAATLILAALMFIIGIDRDWQHAHLLVWFLLLLYMVFAPSLGLPGWGASRAWVYLAVPLAAVVAIGTFIIARSVAGRNDTLLLGILLAVAAAIAFTSLPAKIAVQTAQWTPGFQWTPVQVNGQIAYPELQGYLQMQQMIPRNSRVLVMCGGDQRAIGFDMQADPWNLERSAFHHRIINASGEEIVDFMTRHEYQYLTMDVACVRLYGENATVAAAERLTQTQRFRQVISQPGFFLAQLV